MAVTTDDDRWPVAHAGRPPSRGRPRDRRGLPAPHPRGLNAAAQRGRTGGIRTRCYTPGRAKEPRHRRIACQGAHHRALSRRRLPGPGVLRPCPRPAREPGQGQVRRGRRPRLRTRVRDLGRPPQAGRRHREGRQERPTRSTSPPTSTARARRSPGTWPRRPTCPPTKTRRVTFNEITESAIREAFAHPRQIDMDLVDAQQTRRIVDRLVGYTLSPLLSRKVRGGLSAGRVQSVAVRLVVEREREIDGLHGARVLDDRGASSRPPPARRSPPSSSASTATPLDVGDEATAERHAAAIQALHPAVTKVGTRTQKRSPAPPFTTSTLQQEASRKLGFSPKRTMSVAQRLYEGDRDRRRPGRAHHLHANRLDRDRRRGDGRGARGHRRALRRAVHDAQGPGLQDEVQGRPGGARVDPPDQLPARPGFAGRLAQAGRAAPVPAHLAARARLADGAQGARDHDDRAGRRRLRAARLGDQGRCSTASPGSTPRAATTRRPTTTRRPARCPRSPRATARRVARRHPDPALHRAAAALHGGDADQGARGARHRPAVDLRRDDLDDHRPRLRPGRGAPAPPGARRARS